MRWWPWRKPPPAVDMSDLAAAREVDLRFERTRLNLKRDLLRADLVAIIAEIDRRNPPRGPAGRRSSSVRVVTGPAEVNAEAAPDG